MTNFKFSFPCTAGKFTNTAVVLTLLMLIGCGGSSDNSDGGTDQLNSNQIVQSVDGLDDNLIENDSDVDTQTPSNIVDDTSQTSPPTNTSIQEEANTLDSTGTNENTNAPTDPETDATDNQTTEPQPVEQPVETGFSRQLLSCEEAGDRIRSSIELGMSEAQVLSLVGRPLDTGPSGDRWRYGRLGTPSVKFQPLFLNGHLVNGPVSGFDTDNTRCDYHEAEKDVPLREAANSLLTQTSNADFTNETPTCFDAGVRVTALIKQGLTSTEVRSLIGKPVEVSIGGTIWDYGDGTATPEVWFGSTIENGVLAPTIVQGWDGDIRGCD